MPLPFTEVMMTLYEDSRQQVGKHKNIERYCEKHGIQLVRKCLSVGDYMDDPENGKVSVDTKMDLMELCKDVMSSDHRRFRAECIRAQEQGIQLIVLVEEEPPYGKVDLWEVPRWKGASNKFHRYGDPLTRVNPTPFRKALETMTAKYGVKFRFCQRSQTPVSVIKYLKGEYK